MADNNFDFDIQETIHSDAKIKAIGVGGGGGNMINHMISEGFTDIDLIVTNTDAQALDLSNAPFKIQLGEGLGAGMKPHIGRTTALDSYEEIKSSLVGADIVFISAGLGGGTGTGASPIVAQAAKEIGALTICVVTMPFIFEGRQRTKLAKEGLEELKKSCDSLIVIPNEKLLELSGNTLGMREGFKLVDDILAQSVNGISSIILQQGIVNIDFTDLETVMSHRGIGYMGTGYAKGKNSATDAYNLAVQSPLLDNVTIDGAKGVLILFYHHPDYPIRDFQSAMGRINDSADEEAIVIFGTIMNENMDYDEMKITIVATGFEESIATNYNDLKQETLFEEPQRLIDKPRRKIVGSDLSEDELEKPAFLRFQMD